MNKNELCWLLVRATGVGLLFNGLRYVLIVFENILVISTGPTGNLLISQSSGLFASWCLEALISIAVGAYLIKNGQIIFKWLSFEIDS